jgi:hypothetical protein
MEKQTTIGKKYEILTLSKQDNTRKKNKNKLALLDVLKFIKIKKVIINPSIVR